MSNNDIDVLAINESRMDSTIPDDVILVYGYSWVGKHRNISGGGGSVWLLHTRYNQLSCIRSDLNDTDIEILTIEIFKNKNKQFLITTWYRPPY